MSGAVELEAELLAGGISFAGFSQFHVDMWKDGDFQTHVPGIRAALADAISKTTALLDTIATLRSDNERLGRELTKCENMHLPEATSAAFIGHMNCMKAFDEMQKQKFAAEAERDTLLAQVARVERVLCDLDPENAIDDSLLRDVHARLQVHGEKYPDRAVSVLHRNVVFYTIQAAVRAALTKEPS